MAPQLLAGLRYVGVSTDTKPSSLDTERWTFEEKDTGRIYQWNGTEWIEYETTKEAKNRKAQEPRSSLISLFGDTFAQTAASSIYLLEDVTEKGGGTSLTNNGTITFAKDDDLPLRGHLVPDTLDGSTQYFSVATEAAVEVGTGSFTVSIDFKTTDTGNSIIPCFYGDNAASEQNWVIQLDGNGAIRCIIDDGTNSASVIGPEIEPYNDGKWHTATMLVDRDSAVDLMYLFVDGRMLTGGTDISAVTLTLDNVGTNMLIGARNNSGIGRYFPGQLSNFQLYKAADYNLPALLNAGIRESVSLNGVADLAASSAARLNNLAQMTNGDGNYSTTIINTSEGYYDLIHMTRTSPSFGIIDIDIDGIEVLSHDTYSAGDTYNVKSSALGIFLSAGTHILKYRIDGQNGSSSSFANHWQMIELIKRDGLYNESDEATSGILFGDELEQRQNAATTAVVDTSAVFNSRHQTGSADGDYTEGDIFIKKGNYKIIYTYLKTADSGHHDVWFGGVKVIDQLDGYDASTIYNNQLTKFVFLEGGKTTIKRQGNNRNGSASFYRNYISSIRFELVSGKGNGDEVNIWGADDDVEVVQGTFTLAINTNQRFNHWNRQATPALNDQILYRRYFSGGTYAIKYLYVKDSSGGITDIGLDSAGGNNVFDGVDQQNAINIYNNELNTVMDISRGFHDISFFNEADGDSSDWRILSTHLQFTKIATVIDAVNDDNSDGVHGSLVPLATHIAKIAESTHTINFGGLGITDQVNNYDKIIVSMTGESTASAGIQALIGTAVANYGMDGNKSAGGTQTAIDLDAQTELQLMDATGGFRRFYIEIEIMKKENGNSHLMGSFHSYTVNVLDMSGSWTTTAFDFETIDSILIKTDASTWTTGTTINIYGVKTQ